MPIDQDSSRSRIIVTPRSRRPDPAQKRTDEEREVGHPPHSPTPAGSEGPSGRLRSRPTVLPGRGSPVQIGRFTVLSQIGQGGMGVVYACYDEKLDRKVAVKVLHVEVVRDLTMAKARLLREAQTMARLSHPNIVTVYEVGQDEELVHIAMEFVRGVGLDAWITPNRSWQEILAVLVQAGRGLEAAHRAGIIHRDFKPKQSRLPPKASLSAKRRGSPQIGAFERGTVCPGVVRSGQDGPKLAQTEARSGYAPSARRSIWAAAAPRSGRPAGGPPAGLRAGTRHGQEQAQRRALLGADVAPPRVARCTSCGSGERAAVARVRGLLPGDQAVAHGSRCPRWALR